VFKTIETAAPHLINDIRYFYNMSSINYRLGMLSTLKRVATWTAAQIARALSVIAPTQGNQFGFSVLKRGYKPWIDAEGKQLRRDFALDFDPKKYRGYF
jgi:hypothetical protein